ncbi:hypothetical protein KUTeg_007763 [Tegillarca granosa]|uniref:THAP-type domain-containing protein n=1 Tax=Tegillarca granosa TaxID=220873 RepID=A0ABQ9FIQ0_TEGGR|nr:hypothetical protein KUTeg_007763 [Tegillarca granosa]
MVKSCCVFRRNWIPTVHTYICSEHFVDAWHSDDPADSNYAATFFAYKLQKPTSNVREQRLQERNYRKIKVENNIIQKDTEQEHMQFSLSCHSLYCSSTENCGKEVNTMYL